MSFTAGNGAFEVDPLDVMIKPNLRVAMRGITEGLSSSGDPTSAAGENFVVQTVDSGMFIH